MIVLVACAKLVTIILQVKVLKYVTEREKNKALYFLKQIFK